MDYRGPSFLAVLGFGSFPSPLLPLLSVSSTGDTQEDLERETRGASENKKMCGWCRLQEIYVEECEGSYTWIQRKCTALQELETQEKAS